MIKNVFYIIITSIVLFLPFTGYTQYISGQSYFGANNYIEYIAGNLPIIIVAPHGGYLEPDSLPTIHSRGRDAGSQETTLLLKDSIMAQTGGFWPHVIINHLYPGKMTASDEIDSAAGTNSYARQAWNDFHDFINIAKAEVTNTWLKGHYLEMHGNGHSEMWNEIGLGVSSTYLNGSDTELQSRASKSTIKNLVTVEGVNFIEVVKGTSSLGGLLDARGWKSVSSPSYPGPGSGGFFMAGWNTWLHGSKYSGTIDATHLESYYVFMQSANREQYANDLAESMLQFMETHYGFDFSCPSLYVNTVSGSIITHVDGIINAMPSTTGGNDYVEPTSSNITTWRTIIQKILTGDYCSARTAAGTINYQVVEFVDTTTTPNITYSVLERTSASTNNYWGTFIYNTSALRPKLFIQSPHPLNDLNTGQEGLHIFHYCGALAFYTSGAHRCNSDVSSACDGTTTTCSGSSENYRDSDQAHVTQGMLHVTTEELESAIGSLVVIQPHGFSKGAGDPDLILSNGTRETPSPDYLVSLKNNLTILDNNLTFKVGHIDLSWNELLGTTNMQGRYINGVASPCNNSSTSTTGRFLHVEQAYTNLRDNLSNWNKVANAVAMTFTANNVQANNNFLEFDGYNDYVSYSNDAVLQKLDGASNYTLEAWLYIADENDIDSYDVIFNRDNSFMIQLRSSLRVSFRILKSDSTWAYHNSNNNAIAIAQWNHVAVIRDTTPEPNTLKIFVNGTDVSGNTWTGYTMRSDGGDLYIGHRSNNTNHLKGFIDEVRLKNNAEYSSNLHSSTTSPLYTWDGNTAGIFHFDEGNGFSGTNNEAGHWATLGSSTIGDYSEPTWRPWNYLPQDLSLPVHLISFNAQIVGKSVQLNWTTASELDNYGFEIERTLLQKNGTSSIPDDWVTLGFLEGHGNSSTQNDYSFIDERVSPGLYQYRLKQIDTNGSFEFSEAIEVQIGIAPKEYVLEHNFPNPFNPVTKIKFALPVNTDTNLSVYNILGERVATVVNKHLLAGYYEYKFDGSNLSSGLYFYILKSSNYTDVKKMLLVK